MGQTILIVDDFKDYAVLLEKNLKTEGYQTKIVNDGENAIRTAKTDKPDLILLDIMMPNIGGTEVRIELMKDVVTKNIPIIFLTGLRAPRSKKKPLHDGVRVVGKSNSFTELMQAIRETLPKPAQK